MEPVQSQIDEINRQLKTMRIAISGLLLMVFALIFYLAILS